MFDRLHSEQATDAITVSLRAIVADFDAARLTSDHAAGFVDRFAVIERLASAGKTLAAGRVADGDGWQSEGDRSAADWLAKRTGGTVTESRDTLRTAAKLSHAPGTDAAFRAGQLSAKQAEAIASAAAADPGSESRLLDMAQYQSLQKLRDECARVEAAADSDPTGRHQRIRKNRFWKRWTNRDGSRAGTYCGTPEEVALFEAHAQPFIDARLDQARKTGEREPSEAYAFDGLMAMADAAHHHLQTDHDATNRSGGVDTNATDDTNDYGGVDLDHDDVDDTDADADDGDDIDDIDDVEDTPDEPTGDDTPATPPVPAADVRRARGGRGRKRLSERRELIAIVNLESLNRGSITPGELCEIPGVGPIPLDVARDLFGDALLRIVIRDGTDIRTVVHTGRTANALQETAILVRQLGRCAEPGCDLPIREIDHTTTFAADGPCTINNFGGLCSHHHDLKTRHGHTYRRNADGTITWITPDDADENERPPPPT